MAQQWNGFGGMSEIESLHTEMSAMKTDIKKAHEEYVFAMDLKRMFEKVIESNEAVLSSLHENNPESILKVKLLTSNAMIPTRATEQAAGWDLKSAYEYYIREGEQIQVLTDVAIEIPSDSYAKIESRSSSAIRMIESKGGVIDKDFRGGISVLLKNNSKHPTNIYPGDKVAQLIITKIHYCDLEIVESLTETGRGAKGFGSSGINDSKIDVELLNPLSRDWYILKKELLRNKGKLEWSELNSIDDDTEVVNTFSVWNGFIVNRSKKLIIELEGMSILNFERISFSSTPYKRFSFNFEDESCKMIKEALTGVNKKKYEITLASLKQIKSMMALKTIKEDLMKLTTGAETYDDITSDDE